MFNDTASKSLSNLIDHIDGAYAPNTIRAYKSDMGEFIRYCASENCCALPAEPAVIARFLQQTLSQNIKSATICRKVSSISAIHRLSCLNDPTKHPEVKITLRKIFRQLGRRFDQAFPITRPILEKMLAVCNKDLHGLRDKALLLLAYDSMCRRSELIALRVEDMGIVSQNQICILLRKSKTDQQGSGKFIHLSRETIKTVEDWLAAAKITSGFILRGIKPNGVVTGSLCDSRIGRIYKTLATRAQLSGKIVQSISGHSMRVGGAQDLLALGASLPQIMVKGGWVKPDTVMRYVERVRGHVYMNM